MIIHGNLTGVQYQDKIVRQHELNCYAHPWTQSDPSAGQCLPSHGQSCPSRTSVSTDWHVAMASKFTAHGAHWASLGWDPVQSITYLEHPRHCRSSSWCFCKSGRTFPKPSLLILLAPWDVGARLVSMPMVATLDIDCVNFCFGVRSDRCHYHPNTVLDFGFINGFHWKMNLLCFDQNKFSLLS